MCKSLVLFSLQSANSFFFCRKLLLNAIPHNTTIYPRQFRVRRVKYFLNSSTRRCCNVAVSFYLLLGFCNVQMFLIKECMLKYMGFIVLFFTVVSNWASRIMEFHWYWYLLLNFWYRDIPIHDTIVYTY